MYLALRGIDILWRVAHHKRAAARNSNAHHKGAKQLPLALFS